MTKHMSSFMVRLLSTAVLLLTCNSVIAEEKESSGLLKQQATVAELIKLLSATKGMSARFHQESMSANGEALQQTQGTMKLQRPGKFYWHTLEPFEQEINSDGKRIWVYDVDLEQVSIQDVDPGLGQTPAALLSGEPDKVVRKFYVERSLQAGGIWRYTLKPREENALFSSVELQFSGKALVYMKLSDSLSQTTTVQFADVKLNPDFSPQAFMLQFPEGVDIIDSSLSQP
ncbi:MAG: outer membrane lipoprotein chaperone LolA [Pseudomonadales bacterium]|nr:outer membrane lipoprotein chaperone LolA [Pseudomonadales bacterium]